MRINVKQLKADHKVAKECDHTDCSLTRADVSVCNDCASVQYYNVDSGKLEWFLDGEKV